MYRQDPRDELYSALMRGDYSAITESPSIPVEDPRSLPVVIPRGLEYMNSLNFPPEPEFNSRGYDQEYGRQAPLPASPSPLPNGRGMMSSATQAGDAAIPQNTNEYKIEAPTFAAAFRKMREMGAPEGVNFVWYVNGKQKGVYKYAYANGQKKPAPKPQPPAPAPAPAPVVNARDIMPFQQPPLGYFFQK